jgi:hypothetical protein
MVSRNSIQFHYKIRLHSPPRLFGKAEEQRQSLIDRGHFVPRNVPK